MQHDGKLLTFLASRCYCWHFRPIRQVPICVSDINGCIMGKRWRLWFSYVIVIHYLALQRVFDQLFYETETRLQRQCVRDDRWPLKRPRNSENVCQKQTLNDVWLSDVWGGAVVFQCNSQWNLPQGWLTLGGEHPIWPIVILRRAG